MNIPEHVAIVMDGNGRWAKERGLPRTKGHEAGEAALFDVVQGAIEFGVKEISAYAFSTENWRRSPDEVKFLMGFNRDVIRRRRDEMNAMGVRIRWVGRPKRLWASVISELEEAEELTKKNKVLTLNMCVNYGGRSEIVDAATELARDVKRGKVKADAITEKTFAKYLDSPTMRDVDLFLRSSGEQRTSNFCHGNLSMRRWFLWMFCGQMSHARLYGKLLRSTTNAIVGLEKRRVLQALSGWVIYWRRCG
jgi:undecaprenyl diphosphate synthase